MPEKPTGRTSRRRLDALIRQLKTPRRDAPGAPEIAPRRGDGPWPLSLAQTRLWLLQRLAPESATYNLPGLLDLRGPLDPDALDAALSALVARHEALRARFHAVSGDPVQRIESPEKSAPRLGRIDLDALDAADAARELDRRTRREARRPFDLEHGPLLRAVLPLRADRDTVLGLTLHHIAADGWSLGILLAELAELYAAARERRPARLAPLAISSVDFAVAQRADVSGGQDPLAASIAALRAHLDGTPILENSILNFDDTPARSFGVCSETTHRLGSIASREVSRRPGSTSSWRPSAPS